MATNQSASSSSSSSTSSSSSSSSLSLSSSSSSSSITKETKDASSPSSSNGHETLIDAIVAVPNGKSLSTKHPHSYAHDHGHTNGVSSGVNGAPSTSSAIPSVLETPSGFTVDRSALLRIMCQSLRDIGCSRSAAAIEEESGIVLEEEFIGQFRSGVLNGDWTLVDNLVPRLQVTPSDAVNNVYLLIYEQRFLELLEAGKTSDALIFLRTKISPRHTNAKKVSKLSSLVLYTDVKQLRREAEWDGAAGLSRKTLLHRLTAYIPASVLLPSQRLLTLLDHSIRHQIVSCPSHTTQRTHFSLLEDHECPLGLPHDLLQVVEGHSDEVLFLAFSASGRFLASGGKDKNIIIWSVDSNDAGVVHIRQLRALIGHTLPIGHLVWSPNDRFIVSAADSNEVKLWNVTNGECVLDLAKHSEPCSASAWLPDSSAFVTAGLDKKVFVWDMKGGLQHTFNTDMVLDSHISSDGQRLVVATATQKIIVFNMKTRERDAVFSESSPITSFSLSRDGRWALVNVSRPAAIHLWDLFERDRDRALLHTYTGAQQHRYIIRSCFGGPEESFIISGSEDSQVYVWHRQTTDLLCILSGHSAPVNSVAWCTNNDTLFASASDDFTIRLWGKAKGSKGDDDNALIDDRAVTHTAASSSSASSSSSSSDSKRSNARTSSSSSSSSSTTAPTPTATATATALASSPPTATLRLLPAVPASVASSSIARPSSSSSNSSEQQRR